MAAPWWWLKEEEGPDQIAGQAEVQRPVREPLAWSGLVVAVEMHPEAEEAEAAAAAGLQEPVVMVAMEVQIQEEPVEQEELQEVQVPELREPLEALAEIAVVADMQEIHQEAAEVPGEVLVVRPLEQMERLLSPIHWPAPPYQVFHPAPLVQDLLPPSRLPVPILPVRLQ